VGSLAGPAQSAALVAYNALVAMPCTVNGPNDLTGKILGTSAGAVTLTAGVYCFPATSAELMGTLTLDAQNNPNAVFVFQIGSTLTTASSSAVVLINGAQDGNVFWQVGSSATIGTGTVFAGNLVAFTSITLTHGASVSGRALALNGAVTMDTNNVTIRPTISVPPPQSCKDSDDDHDKDHQDGDHKDKDHKDTGHKDHD